jgi:hypothetical protein
VQRRAAAGTDDPPLARVELAPSPYSPSAGDWKPGPLFTIAPLAPDGSDLQPRSIVKRKWIAGRICPPLVVTPGDPDENGMRTVLGIYNGRIVPATQGVPIWTHGDTNSWPDDRRAVARLRSMPGCNFTNFEGQPVAQSDSGWGVRQEWETKEAYFGSEEKHGLDHNCRNDVAEQGWA